MPELGDFRAALVAQARHPRTFVGAAFLAICVGIVANALFLQPRPHPAPFFSTREGPEESVATGNELVREVQDALTQVGYYSGLLDGIEGPQTQSAIRAFERRAGRDPSGKASLDLLVAIRSSAAPASTGSVPPMIATPTEQRATSSTDGPPPQPAPRSELVAAIQNALALSAYGPLVADGVIGPETRAAIMRFQRDHNLPVTGEISEGLVVELRAAGAMHDG